MKVFFVLYFCFVIILFILFSFFSVDEVSAYILWFMVFIAPIGILFQAFIFSFISLYFPVNKITFFFISLLTGLLILNLSIRTVFPYFLSGELVTSLSNNGSWDEISGPLLIHLSFIFAIATMIFADYYGSKKSDS